MLLWMRTASSVEADIYNALVLLFAVVGGVFVLDLLVAGNEVLMMARPLHGLARRMEEVSRMQLAGADFSIVCNPLREIQVIVRAFQIMVDQLRLYRSFLPQAVLQDLDHGRSTRISAPTGKIAVCFTDIVGSTRLWDADPHAMNDAMETHNDAIRQLLRSLGGYEVKTIGDSFMTSWADPVAAVLFAARVHEALLAAPWPDCAAFDEVSERWPRQVTDGGEVVWGGLCVRIGVAYGEVLDEVNPVTQRTDYRGTPVNLAARLESTAPHGGVQVCASLYRAVKDDGKLKGFTFKEVRGVELRGLGVCDTHLVVSQRLIGRMQGSTQPVPMVRQSVVNEAASVSSKGSTKASMSTKNSFRARARSVDSASSEGALFEALLRSGFTHSLGSVAAVCVDGSGGDTAGVTRTTERLVLIASRTQGVVGALMGGSLQITWNVTCQCASHDGGMVRFTLLAAGFGTCRGGIGGSSGMVWQGSVGTSRQRFHIVLGIVPKCASYLASLAENIGATALTAFPGSTPDALREFLRPVDVWQLSQRGSDGQLWVVEEPQEPETWSPTANTRLSPEYRGLFFRALAGDSESLDTIRKAACPTDRVMEVVTGALAKHLERFPQGRSFRMPVPFLQPTSAALPEPPDPQQDERQEDKCEQQRKIAETLASRGTAPEGCARSGRQDSVEEFAK
eukprot:TRINITY_DN4207_c0_g1_i11.p1 TRINITY_DN4207_c0_g1~~TRINITY_DN4207_c0_g1_i11.p1  ORF type:complete len:679 (+),score=222.27 TRINITY_DN4207_c0_g1_i11:1476-3512(+)